MSKKSHKAFTLIEVLIVIAIIGLLTTIVLVSITSTRSKARDNRRMAELLTLGKSLEFYYSEHGQYPESADWIKIEENATFTTAMAPYISRTPEDPSYDPANEYSYQYTTETTGGAEYKACATMETYEDPYCLSSVFGGNIVWDGGAGGGSGGSCVGINISDCAVLDQAGETYCLTQDIIDSATSSCINITADNITFDGQGYTIDGDSDEYGIYIHRDVVATTSVTIRNVVVSDWYTNNIYLSKANGNTLENITSLSSLDEGDGISLNNSSFNTLSDITASNNSCGIYFSSSGNNTIENSTLSDNLYGIYFYDSGNNTIENSTLSDNNSWDLFARTANDDHCPNFLTNVIGTGEKPILYINSSTTISNSNNEYSAIILCNADGSNFNNVTIDHAGLTQNNGILLIRTNDANFTDINVNNLRDGFNLWYSSDSNTFTNITSTLNNTGIILQHSSFNTFSNVTANSNHGTGISMNNGSADNIFSDSTANDNGINGFSVYLSLRNLFTNTTANFNDNGYILLNAHETEIRDSSINSNNHGIYFQSYYPSSHVIITNTDIKNNATTGINMCTRDIGPNTIYNNIFNNNTNFTFNCSTLRSSNWSTSTPFAEPNIIGGSDIGGNYWTNSSATGYSDTCADADSNGFCDTPYTLASDNIDSYPLKP